MKPEFYQKFYCHRCGWGICAFIESDMVEKYKKRKQYPNCPYCKVRGTGVFSGTGYEPYMPKIREPVVLRKPFTKQVREEVLKKYGGKCVICGSTKHLQIDHIVPAIDNGSNALDNLQVLCRKCNASKGARSEISERRKTVLLIKQSCAHLVGKKHLSMAEMSRVSGVKYHRVLEYQYDIREELGLSHK